LQVGLGAADVKKAQDCQAGDTNACAESGQRAAQAVGIPLGGLTQGAANARKCNNDDRNACIALGKSVFTAALEDERQTQVTSWAGLEESSGGGTAAR
jgi:hypothetical protein